MQCSDLTTDQAKVISDALYPGANYLSRLYAKMEKMLSADDKLFKLVAAAYIAMRYLTSEVHYLTVESGVGRPPKDEKKKGA